VYIWGSIVYVAHIIGHFLPGMLLQGMWLTYWSAYIWFVTEWSICL